MVVESGIYWMLRIVLQSLLLFAFVAQSGFANAEPKPFSVVVEVRKLSSEKLSGVIARGYSRWTERKLYFGAFAFNNETDEYSYWRNVHSLGSVVEFVMKDCQNRAKKPCELYAVMVPKGFPKNVLKGSGLNSTSGKDFKEYLSRHEEGKFSAFAISGTGSNGYSWSYNDKDEAENAATLQCMSGLAADLADYGKLERDLVQKMGLTSCEIIDVRQ